MPKNDIRSTTADCGIGIMSKKILITDDSLFMRGRLKAILIASGFTDIIEASDGNEAIAMFKAHQPDIVLMDITMPGMDGIAATRAIRGLYPNAKIVVCSAMGQKEMVLDAVHAGAAGFIVKPFESDCVVESVKKLSEAA